MQLLGNAKSNPNADLTLIIDLTGLGHSIRVGQVQVVYSANVAVNADVSLDSHLGPDYDVLWMRFIFSGNRYGLWIPEDVATAIAGDKVTVLLPAGGVGITGTVSVYGIKELN